MTLPPRDQLHTVDQAAEVLDVPAGTIRRWARAKEAMPSGHIRSRGRGGIQPLFKLEELEHLAARYHANHRRRRTA